MKIDAVFSGGGVKAFAYLGALESMQKKNITIERVAGTSAGAIIAGFLAAGYTIDELKKIFTDLNLDTFLDVSRICKFIPGSKWFFLYFQKGIYKGDVFENWLYEHLAQKNIHTFSDLPEGYLKVVVSDLTLGKLIVIPDDLERVYGLNPNHFPVAKAIRMSSGFPYFFIPKKLPGRKEKSIIVDGGLLSNFPLWVFEQSHNKRMRPIIGVKLTDSVENTHSRKIKNAFDMLYALFSTMKQAHDARYVSKSDKANIVFIPVNDIQTVDFKISEELKEQLMEIGRQRTEMFLNKWTM